MVQNILIALGAIVVAFVVLVATRSPTFHVERAVVVSTPPDAPFALVDDFHQWAAWSPWEKLDPTMNKTFAGPASGAGAVYSWAGDKKVGEGRMTIERSDPPSRVVIKLEFLKPFAATNTATFTFAPEPGGTKVTWAMDGEKNFMAKAFHMFVDMDKLVGGDFERGLAAMKIAAESGAPQTAETGNAAK